MKKLLIALSIFFIFANSITYATNITDVMTTGMAIIGLFFIYLPMIIIEAFVLRWLFIDFDTEDSILASFFINFISIVFIAILMTSTTADAVLQRMGELGLITIVVINILLQLLVLKLRYKAVLSVKGMSGIVFSHIASIGVLKLWHYFLGPVAY